MIRRVVNTICAFITGGVLFYYLVYKDNDAFLTTTAGTCFLLSWTIGACMAAHDLFDRSDL